VFHKHSSAAAKFLSRKLVRIRGTTSEGYGNVGVKGCQSYALQLDVLDFFSILKPERIKGDWG